MEWSNQASQDFLKQMARDYQLSNAQTRVFLTRFTYEHRQQQNTAIAKRLNLEAITVQGYMRDIYKKFARTKENPDGCPLDRQRGNRDQFGTLFDWLWQEKFKEWSEQLQRPIQIEVPEGQVPLESPFYIERVDAKCYRAVEQPNCLLRIKAPKQMGKTSLMTRVLEYARQKEYRIIYLDFEEVENEVLRNLDKLLRWLCYKISRQLKIPNRLNEHWNPEILSSASNCTDYFETYFLSKADNPLVLGIDAVDKVLAAPEVAQDFFSLLRAWHESGKTNPDWKKLQLVIAYSTEVYVPLDIHLSPFNVGLSVELPELSPTQVRELAKLHQLEWNEAQVAQLTDMVGGHPYLVRVALYHIAHGETTLEQLLKQAPTGAGVYARHLLRHWESLKQTPKLTEVMKKVARSSTPVQVDPTHAHSLDSLGLIEYQGNGVIPSCNLYRQYFS